MEFEKNSRHTEGTGQLILNHSILKCILISTFPTQMLGYVEWQL